MDKLVSDSSLAISGPLSTPLPERPSKSTISYLSKIIYGPPPPPHLQNKTQTPWRSM